MKRIALFLATNLAIVLVLSVTMRLFGIEPWLTAQGINFGSLLIFAAVFGSIALFALGTVIALIMGAEDVEGQDQGDREVAP